MSKFDFPVFIFGAGATIGSGYYLGGDPSKKPPDNENFFKELDPKLQNSVPALKAICDALNIRLFEKKSNPEISLEMLWNYIYITRRYVAENLTSIVSMLNSRFKESKLTGQYPHRVLVNPKVGLDEKLSRLAEIDLIYLVWLILRSLKIQANGQNTYEKLFKETDLISEKNELKRKFAVISFNYDICLEESLKKLDNLFYYPNFGIKYTKDFIPIFKLHGSLNWKHGIDGHVRPTDNYEIINEEEFIAKGQELFPQAWKDYVPMIIPPTFFKEELFFRTGQEKVRRHFTELWRQAYQLVREASCLIIIGYSFPEADPHARWLLKAAGDRLSFIVNKYCDEKDKRKYENIVKSCLNKVDAFCHEGFDGCFKEIKEWINK